MNNNILDYFKKNFSDTDYSIKEVSRGVSSKIYYVQDNSGNRFAVKVLLSSADILSLKRIKWQYDLQNYLSSFIPVPRVLDYSMDSSIIGSPFYIMEWNHGRNSYDKKSIYHSFNTMASLHSIEVDGFLSYMPYAKTPTERFVSRLVSQYQIRSPDDPEKIIADWLIDNIPKNERYSFVHGDWKMSNMLFSENKLSAILDWELSEICDPRIDLGIAMAYWPEHSWISIEKKYEYRKQDIIDEYFSVTKFDRSDWPFFEVLGIFRLMAIARLIENNNSLSLKNKNIPNDIRLASEKCKRIISSI